MDNKASIVIVCLVLALSTYIYVESEKETTRLKDINKNMKIEQDALVNKILELERQLDSLQVDYNTQQDKLKGVQDDLDSKTKELDATKKKLKPVSRGGLNTNFTATAYCGCRKCNGKWTGQPTASGTGYKAGRTIAVDPKVIPLGSRVEINGKGGYIAEDTGSAIKGNIIDIYFNTHSEALQFGRRKVNVKILK